MSRTLPTLSAMPPSRLFGQAADPQPSYNTRPAQSVNVYNYDYNVSLWCAICVVALCIASGWIYISQRGQISELTDRVDVLTRKNSELVAAIEGGAKSQALTALQEQLRTLTAQVNEMNVKVSQVCFFPKPSGGALIAPC